MKDRSIHYLLGLILIAFACSFPQASRADYERCAALFDALPNNILDYRVGKKEGYGDRDLGFRASFENSGPNLLTVYFFDMGELKIDGHLKVAMFAQAVSEMDRSNEVRGNTDIEVIQTFARSEADDADLIHASSSLYKGSIAIIDFVSVAKNGDCLVKTRFSTTAPFEEARHVHLQFLDELRNIRP